mmetsp:Transcript_30242/g.72146  ORF Transcript_30242/g.72146 Transcript_30242/m.72146 type:complete len:203 (-) Transcript_30242:44-652(-)
MAICSLSASLQEDAREATRGLDEALQQSARLHIPKLELVVERSSQEQAARPANVQGLREEVLAIDRLRHVTSFQIPTHHLPIVGTGAGSHGLPVHIDAIRAVARKVVFANHLPTPEVPKGGCRLKLGGGKGKLLVEANIHGIPLALPFKVANRLGGARINEVDEAIVRARHDFACRPVRLDSPHHRRVARDHANWLRELQVH